MTEQIERIGQVLTIKDINKLVDTIMPIVEHPTYLLELILNTEQKILSILSEGSPEIQSITNLIPPEIFNSMPQYVRVRLLSHDDYVLKASVHYNAIIAQKDAELERLHAAFAESIEAREGSTKCRYLQEEK